MDRKTLIAVALCVVVLIAYPFILKLFGLDRYLKPAPPPPVATVDTTRGATSAPERGYAATGETTGTDASREARATPRAPVLSALPLKPLRNEIARAYRIETPLYHAEFTSRGARLISVELLHYASAHGGSSRDGKAIRPRQGEPVPPGDQVVLAGGPSFSLDLGSGSARMPLDDLVYAAEESLDAAGQVRRLTFTAEDSSGMRIRQTWRVRPDTYALDLEVEIHRVPLHWRLADYSLITRSWPLFNEADVAADAQGLHATSMVGTNIHREKPGGLRKGTKRFEGVALWAAVQTRYFMGAVAALEATAHATEARAALRPLTAEQRAILPSGAPPEQDMVVSALIVALPGETQPVNRFLVYFGPNEYFRLARLGVQLERVVDLGWSWISPFSRVLLRLLVWLNGLVRNYGVAIIVLATLVRVLLHPLNMMSLKSMRAMQRLQPEMVRLKEKYKNDAQAMNTAVMALYKEHKVNPAGGCLPMLLQMPLFFALYSVLFNAIELRQAPFVAWIHDLSAPDKLFEVAGFPIRLLPILMAGSGFLTQKLTPTDPRQASTMYLMNAVMVVFFYNLPSGLVLYWTVMNLLTALQQWLALREDGSSPAPAGVEVGGPPPGGSRAGGGQRVARRGSRK
ncbi:MAG: membrane protein insertase YidC [Candidatus Eiseniibacteriota bacterium]